MKPGTIVTDIEGYDLGDEGAVVIDATDGVVRLVRLDNEKTIEVDLNQLDFAAEQPVKPEDPGEWGYDEEAMDSPELHTIRWLPKWWGPRDPNAPSSLTDVMYRPEPYWNRQVHRHYSVDHQEKQMKRRNKRSRRHVRRTAEPVYWMEPTPHRQDDGTHVQRDWGLPRRMRVDLWEEQKDDLMDTEALVAHVVDFWQGYRTKQRSYMSELGDRRNTDVNEWGLMYMHRAGMERPEMDLLYRFMVATTLIPENTYRQFQDILDTYYVYRYDRASM